MAKQELGPKDSLRGVIDADIEEALRQKKYWELWKTGQAMLQTFHEPNEEAVTVLKTHDAILSKYGKGRTTMWIEGRHLDKNSHSLVEITIVGSYFYRGSRTDGNLFTLVIPDPDSSDYSQNKHTLAQLEDAQKKFEYLNHYYEQNIPESQRGGVRSDHP